jgi:hypothetical protein
VQYGQPMPDRVPERSQPVGAWPMAGIIFAGSAMLLVGMFQIFQGLAALMEDTFFVVSSDYAYELDVTTWGWIHLILGILVALAGFYVFSGQLWARLIGIGLAILSATANFFWLPYYPVWSLLIIAVNIVVIWGLATYGRKSTMDSAG